MMKFNPRARPVNDATVDLRFALHKISEDYNLTTNELMQILTETTYQLFRNLVRAEQQPEE